MAAILQKFKEQGWFISEEGLKKISDDGQVSDVKELIKKALDTDLREISKGGALSSDNMKSSKLDVPSYGAIVQVMAVRNVSAPKANEESKTAPRMLNIDLTDGQNVCCALEMEPVQCLSITTAPGTKILLKGNIKMSHNLLLLTPGTVSVCGGNVTALFERWEHQRIMAKYAKGIRPNAGPNGPPPWITFGAKAVAQPPFSRQKAFRSLGGPDEDAAESKENVEFTAMRSKAIASANEAKSKKVFGGGKRSLVDHNVKKIVDKGYTEEDAKFALKYARNNLERAMGNLKRDRANGGAGAVATSSGREREDRREGRGGAAKDYVQDTIVTKVSLFDFLTDKIPMVTESIPVYPTANSTTTGRSAASNKPMGNHFSATTTTNNSLSSNHHPSKRFTDDYSNNNINFNHNSTANSRRSDDNHGNNRRSDATNQHHQQRKHEENPFRKVNSGRSASVDEAVPLASARSRGGATKSNSARAPAPMANGTSSSRSAATISNNNNNASSTSAVSSSNPFSLENRAKFQNNMSASFANRASSNGAPAAVVAPAPDSSRRKDNTKSSVVPSTGSGKGNNTTRGQEQRNESSRNNQLRKTMGDSGISREGGSQTSVGSAGKSVGKSAGASDSTSTTTKDRRPENPFSKPLDQRRGNAAKAEPTKGRPTVSPAIQLAKATAALSLNEPPRPKPPKSAPMPNAHASSSSSSSATTASNSTTAFNQPTTNNRTKSHPSKSELLKLFNPDKNMFFTNQDTSESCNMNRIMSCINKENNDAAQNISPSTFELFNPNKIMGFTNKETNEVAQNVLKAVAVAGSDHILDQLLGAAVAASSSTSTAAANAKLAASSTLSPLPQAFVPAAAVAANQPLVHQVPNHSFAVRPSGGSPRKQQHQQQPMHHHQQQQQQPSPMHFQAQPLAGQTQHFMAAGAAAPSIGLQPFAWPLKMHDLCFAKYWEDGRYYNAEITGVSAKTCVVEFMEYGNFEEVLLTDCVPINDINIQLVEQYNAGLLHASATAATQYQAQPQQHHVNQVQAAPMQMVAVPYRAVQQQQQQQQQQPMHQQPLLQTPHPYQQPIHNPHHQMQQQQMVSNNSNNSNNYQQQQQHQQHMQRMRGERQMYVPPAQRSTK